MRQISPNSDLVKLIPAHAKIIVEVGCGSGTTGFYFKQINPHSLYIGIEPNPDLAKIAVSRLDRVISQPFETLEILSLQLDPGSVDCLVYDATQSTIVNPWTLLKQQTHWLTEQGLVLANIPNLQYWRQIVNLVRGKMPIWDGEPELELLQNFQPGLTLDTIENLFRTAGLSIYEIQTRGQKDAEFEQFLQLMKPMVQALGLNQERFACATAAQRYMIRALKSPHPPRRLLIQTAIMAPTGCDRLRVLEPDQLSSTIPGTRAVSAVRSIPQIPFLPAEEKVFIWQRSILSYTEHLNQLKHLLKQDYLIIAEIDDNPLRRREYAENRYLSYRGCHAVQTSTKPLAVFLQQLNPNVAVFTNQLAYLPPPRIYNNNEETVTIFFGALNREKDWQPIMESLNQVLGVHKNRVRVKVIHDQRFFEGLEIQQKEFEPFCSYERYLEILKSCDIGLLPLYPTQINLMKSDLKFIECAGHGVAVLASPTVYENSIVPGKTGLIYRTQKQFKTQLHELITNPQLRQELAMNAYQWVKNNRLLCQHYQQRRQWYLSLRDQLPRLNEELRNRVPELFWD